jgi:hypothetical protein
VSDRTGTAFLIIHHSGKPKDNHEDGRMVPRGSSAIFDACGSVFVMTGEKGEPKRVSHVKGAAEAEGGTIDDFCLAIEDVGIDGNPRAGVRVVHEPAEDEEDDEVTDGTGRFEAVKKQVLSVIRKSSDLNSKNAICERIKTKAGRGTKLQAIQELLDGKKIVEINKVFKINHM